MAFTPPGTTAKSAARKSPLRAARFATPTAPAPADRRNPQRREGMSGAQVRQMMISEYSIWLSARTNKHHRPFQPDTVLAYTETARVLDRWMTGEGIDADFTGCDTTLLNRFFTDYFADHSQGGTNTRQRNLRHLFTWLEEAYGHPHPYTDALHRYAPVLARPSTLAQEFIADLLAATGGGRARDFETARDHAIIRMLTEGVRREELAQQHTEDLSADPVARPFIRVIPLKGARAATEGRIVPLSPGTSRALVAYLRARRTHRKASSPALWLGTNNRGPMTGSGVYRMLKRRAVQAGYEPAVHPHQFRHTFANDWLEHGGTEGDLMRLMGWSDRSMLDRYGADLAVHRAVEAKQRMGDLY